MWAINLHCWRQRQGNSNDEARNVVVERGGTWWNVVERGGTWWNLVEMEFSRLLQTLVKWTTHKGQISFGAKPCC